MNDTKYTLVQHSGWTAGRDPRFVRAVELDNVSTKKKQERIKKAGGVLFFSYEAASDQEYRENYPPEVSGMCPGVRGSFSRVRHDGAAIYKPDAKRGLVREKEVSA